MSSPAAPLAPAPAFAPNTPAIARPALHDWLVLLIILLVYLAARWPFRELPLMRDEGEYAQLGQAIRAGLVPYRDIYNQKPPVVFYLFTALQAGAGEGLAALRIATTLWAAASIAGVWLLAWRLLGPVGAPAAALVMAELLFDLAGVFHSASTELFMLLWFVLGLLCWYPAARRSSGRLLAAGALAALACLTKQTGVALLLFFLADRARGWLVARRDGDSLRAAALDGLHLLLGFATVHLALIAYLASQGALRDYLDCVWTNNFAYVGERHASLGLLQQVHDVALYLVQPAAAVTWIAGIAGCLAASIFARRGDAGGLGLLAGALLAFAALAGTWYVQYFVPLVLPLALGCGYLLARLVAATQRGPHSIPLGIAAAVLAMAVFGGPIWKQASTLRHPAAAIARAGAGAPFDESALAADYLARHTAPNEPVAVFGTDPEIYFYARRRPASRMVITYPAFGPYTHSAGLREEFLAGLRDPRVRYIVHVNYPGALSEFPEHALDLASLGLPLERVMSIPDRHDNRLSLDIYRKSPPTQ